MKLAYSSLACIDWSWEQILDGACRNGFQGVEIRLCDGEVDLTKAEPFRSGRLQEARSSLQELGLTVVGLGSSCRLHESRAKPENLDHARIYIDLAAALGAPYVRVFPDKLPPDVPRSETLGVIVEGLRSLADYAAPKGVTVLLESHGDVVTGSLLGEVMERVDHPGAALLWDSHHTWRVGGEAPSETWQRIKKWVRHVHVKDSRAAESGFRYCPFGEGEYPVAHLFALLRGAGYDGWVALEHERKWHPYLAPPEEALPQFMAYMRQHIL